MPIRCLVVVVRIIDYDAILYIDGFYHELYVNKIIYPSNLVLEIPTQLILALCTFMTI